MILRAKLRRILTAMAAIAVAAVGFCISRPALTREEARIMVSLVQGYSQSSTARIMNLSTSGSFRETRFSILGMLPASKTIQLKAEVFGESSISVSIFPDHYTTLQPEIIQAGGEAKVWDEITLSAGIARLPIGILGRTHDIGLAFRSHRQLLYQPLLGFAPRNYRGVGLNVDHYVGEGEIIFDAIYGEAEHGKSFELAGNYNFPPGGLSAITGGNLTPLYEQRLLDPDIMKDFAAGRLEFSDFLPGFSLEGSGWIGKVPEQGSAVDPPISPSKQVDMWNVSMKGEWAYWVFHAEFAQQSIRKAGKEDLVSVQFSADNNFQITENWAILADYMIGIPDFYRRQGGTYRAEFLLAGLEWRPDPSISVQVSEQFGRGELFLRPDAKTTRGILDQLWTFEPYFIAAVSYAYF